MRTLLLVIHIFAAGTWIGASVTSGFLSPRLRTNDVTGAAFMRGFEAMGRFVFNIAGIVVLVSGIWLVLITDWEFSNTFVTVGFLVVIAGAALGIFGFGPLAKRGVAAHESADRSAIDAVYSRFTALGALDLALLVVAVWAMVAKWGA